MQFPSRELRRVSGAACPWRSRGPRRYSCSSWFLWRLRSRQELAVEGGDALGLGFAGGLFFAQQERELAELKLQFGNGGLAVAQAGIEFAFSKVKDMGANFERLLLFGRGALSGLEFELG